MGEDATKVGRPVYPTPEDPFGMGKSMLRDMAAREALKQQREAAEAEAAVRAEEGVAQPDGGALAIDMFSPPAPLTADERAQRLMAWLSGPSIKNKCRPTLLWAYERMQGEAPDEEVLLLPGDMPVMPEKFRGAMLPAMEGYLAMAGTTPDLVELGVACATLLAGWWARFTTPDDMRRLRLTLAAGRASAASRSHWAELHHSEIFAWPNPDAFTEEEKEIIKNNAFSPVMTANLAFQTYSGKNHINAFELRQFLAVHKKAVALHAVARAASLLHYAATRDAVNDSMGARHLARRQLYYAEEQRPREGGALWEFVALMRGALEQVLPSPGALQVFSAHSYLGAGPWAAQTTASGIITTISGKIGVGK